MRRIIIIALAFTVVVAVAGTAAATHIFSDVPDTSTHAGGIEWAATNGIVLGRTDGTYGPQDPVTRGQLATMLERFHDRSTRPHYLLTPVCGDTAMRVADIGARGSGAATVEFSVDGGDRIQIDEIPAEGFLEFDPEQSGIVSLFVDDLAWGHAPTAESCTTTP
jgi:hypothetical protein